MLFMEVVARSVVFLMLTLALIGQYPASAKLSQEDAERMKNVLERLCSVVIQEDNPSSPEPMLDGDEANFDNINPGGTKLTEKDAEKIENVLEHLCSMIQKDSPSSPEPMFKDNKAEVDGIVDSAKPTEEDNEKIDNLLERLRSVMIAKYSPAPPAPIFEDNEAEVDAGQLDAHFPSIRPSTFKVNDVAGYEIKSAPSTGHVTLYLIDDTNQKVLIVVDARYNWYANHHVLVLNNYDGDWKQEIRPSGFDFTAGKASHVCVKAETNGFQVSQNGKDIALFPYRPGVTATSVAHIQVRSEGNTAANGATLLAKLQT